MSIGSQTVGATQGSIRCPTPVSGNTNHLEGRAEQGGGGVCIQLRSHQSIDEIGNHL